MKIKNKIILFVMIFMTLINLSSTFLYSVNAEEGYADWMEDAQGFIQKGEDTATGVTAKISGVTSSFSEIGKFMTMIGAGVMVAVTTYMGIKYVVSPPDAQAKLKQQLIGVIVSGVVIFGAYGIWQFVGKIAMTFD